jgi:putative spermidine/putrescine transport system permease protein
MARSQTRALPPALWPALGFLLVFYLYPLGDILVLSVTEPQPTLAHYLRLAEVPIYGRVLLNTFEIALMVSAIALLIGYPTAYLLASVSDRVAAILVICVLVPFFTGVLVRNYAWIFMLGNNGVVNGSLKRLGWIDASLPLMYNRFGVVLAMVHVLLPYTILVLLGVMRGIDRRLLAAAASLGSGPFTAFRRVFLPLSLPGIGGAFLLVFVIAVAFFVTPAMLGSAKETMLANLIAQQVGVLNWGFAAALSTLLLVATLVVMAVMQAAFGGFSLIAPELSKKREIRSRAREGQFVAQLDRIMNPVWPALPHAVGAATLAFLLLPILIVLPMSLNPAAYLSFPPTGLSLRWYVAYLTDADWLEATWNSLKIAVLVTALTMLLAVPASLAIARGTGRWAMQAYALILSPMILPSIIIAIAVFFLFARLGLNGTIWGVALGHTIGSLPLAVVVLVAALRNFDRNLERASLSLAAGPLRTVWRVILPGIKVASLTAAFFAFLHSFDEVVIAIFVSGVHARTLPKKMWESLEEINPIITAVSALLILVSVAAVLATVLLRRGTDTAPGTR